VTLYTGFTSDREELLRALDRLERDSVQHEPGPSRESWQVAKLDSGVGVTSEQLRLIRRTLAVLLGAHGDREVDTLAQVELMRGPMTEILTNQLQGIATTRRRKKPSSSPFGPSPHGGAAITASADFSLRRSRSVALSDARRDLPR